jgi:hypothetical protein
MKSKKKDAAALRILVSLQGTCLQHRFIDASNYLLLERKANIGLLQVSFSHTTYYSECAAINKLISTYKL